MGDIIEFPISSTKRDLQRLVADHIASHGYAEAVADAFLERVDPILDAAEETLGTKLEPVRVDLRLDLDPGDTAGSIESMQKLVDTVVVEVDKQRAPVVARFGGLVIGQLLTEYLARPRGA